jgi:hypothetical protein
MLEWRAVATVQIWEWPFGAFPVKSPIFLKAFFKKSIEIEYFKKEF